MKQHKGEWAVHENRDCPHLPNSLYPVDIDNSTFTLKDSGGRFIVSDAAGVTCAPNSAWAGPVGSRTCVRLPEIEIIADPSIVRSGNTAPVVIKITANYKMECNVTGGINESFDHEQSTSEQTYNFTSNPLTAGQIVSVYCEHKAFGPPIVGRDDTRIDVIPTYQEI